MYKLQFTALGICHQISYMWTITDIEDAERKAHQILEDMAGSKYTQCDIFRDNVYVKTIETFVGFKDKQ